MSAIQYLSAFRTFGADVLALALGVTLVTSLFKKTVFKNRSKMLFVFLPFALGLVFYAGYRAIAARSAIPFTEELFRTCEGGFACGCAATLYYVVYEQFFRGKKATALAPLLSGYVAEERLQEAEQELMQGSAGLEDEELLSFIEETLARYALPETPLQELSALARLIAEYLMKLR